MLCFVRVGELIGVASLENNGLLPSYRILSTNIDNGFKIATIRERGNAIFKICSINALSSPFMGYIAYNDNGVNTPYLYFIKLFDTGTYMNKVQVKRIENADGSNTLYVISPSVPISLELVSGLISSISIHYEAISEIPSDAIDAVEKGLYS